MLTVDLRPDQSVEALAAKLARPRGKASLATHLRKTLGLSKIDIAALREASPGGLPQEPQALAARVKAAPLTIAGVAGFERAISTAGGVAFDALNDDLMLKDASGHLRRRRDARLRRADRRLSAAGGFLDGRRGGPGRGALFGAEVLAALTWRRAPAPPSRERRQ